MARLALTDVRAGAVLLPADRALAPVPVVPQPPGDLLGQPYGVTRLPDGRLVIADRSRHRIVAMAEDGSDWATFGTPGAGVGELSFPCGVAVGPDGRIWITDTGNSRIIVVDSMTGDGWTSFGTAGVPTPSDPAVGKFARPVGIAVDTAGVAVADPASARVVRLDDVDGTGWEATPLGTLNGPVAVALLPGGGIVVADLPGRRLVLLDAPAAGVAAEVTDVLLLGPTAVAAITDDLLAVCVAPLTALLAVSRVDGVWSVAVDRRLGNAGLSHPTALCAVPETTP